jgi:SAM-dependent methyltransferase
MTERPGQPAAKYGAGSVQGDETGSLPPRVRAAKMIDPINRSLKFIRVISPHDEMMAGSPVNYFHIGFAAMDCIRLALRAGRVYTRPKWILDLPCGHGRVLRMIKASFPFAQLTACDLNVDGVNFCYQTFGATPVISRPRPEDIELPACYDLIWVGSLLTHVDAPVWSGFLELFSRHLVPGGVVVFTTHGRGTAEELRLRSRQFDIPDPDALVESCAQSGFAFQTYRNADSYGVSLSRPVWVCAELEKHADLELVLYTEGGWNGRQDCVACQRLP